jgi:hypothetical protein
MSIADLDDCAQSRVHRHLIVDWPQVNLNRTGNSQADQPSPRP